MSNDRSGPTNVLVEMDEDGTGTIRFDLDGDGDFEVEVGHDAANDVHSDDDGTGSDDH